MDKGAASANTGAGGEGVAGAVDGRATIAERQGRRGARVRGMFWIARVLGFNAGDDVEKYKSNAAFIAASRSDVPDMAAHIEQLHAALAMRLLLGHNPACGWWCEPSEECDCGFDRITAIQKEYEGAEPAAESVPASAEVKLGMEFVPTRYFTSFGPARVTCPECGGSGFPSIFRTLSDPEAKP